MKIIPKISNKIIKEYVLNEDEGTTVIGLSTDKTVEDGFKDISTNVDKGNFTIKVGDNTSTTTTTEPVLEYKIPDVQRYESWVDVFTKGVLDEKWLTTSLLKKDIYTLAANTPLTDKDLSIIKKTYTDPDFVTPRTVNAAGVILKNAITRRSPLPEDMKVKLAAFDRVLKTIAKDKNINKKKNLERTMDPDLKAHYLKQQGRDSWAEAMGNMMGLPENQKVIGKLLQQEIEKMKKGGQPDLGIKQELYELIHKQKDSKTKIKNRGEQYETDPQDYIPVNLLILYAVLAKDANLVNIAIKAEGQKIDPKVQNRIQGKFTPKLGTMLAKLVEDDDMSEIKHLLLMGRVIPYNKIKPQTENRIGGKTIIISERQAKMLSLLKEDEDIKPIEWKLGGGYYAIFDGNSIEPRIIFKDDENQHKVTNDDDNELDGSINDYLYQDDDDYNELEESTNKLNDYLVQEGINQYKVFTKQQLMEQLSEKVLPEVDTKLNFDVLALKEKHIKRFVNYLAKETNFKKNLLSQDNDPYYMIGEYVGRYMNMIHWQDDVKKKLIENLLMDEIINDDEWENLFLDTLSTYDIEW